MRELAAENQSMAVGQRKKWTGLLSNMSWYFIQWLVLFRSWKMLGNILSRLSRDWMRYVSYWVVKVNKNRKPRVVHASSIKKYVEREDIVARIYLVSE